MPARADTRGRRTAWAVAPRCCDSRTRARSPAPTLEQVDVASLVPSQRRRLAVGVDLAVAAGALALDLQLAQRSSGAGLSLVEATLTGVTLGLIPLRHLRPAWSLALTVVGCAAVFMLTGRETLALLAPLLTLYSVGTSRSRNATMLAWVVTVVVLASAAAIGASDARWQQALRVVPWTTAAAAVGNGVQNRRTMVQALRDRALRAEQTREEEALRRVAEERVRIARELHDVVAHHIAVISVQAGAAQHLVTADPVSAAAALGEVRRAAGTVIDELRDLLYVLRSDDDRDARTTPTPGLARLDALLGSFTAAGLEVDWSLSGKPGQLPATVDLIAYRVAEEALTNALKHGTGSAHLDVQYRDDSVFLRVVNPVSHQRPSSEGGAGGHGLLGMRERAAAVGGHLDVGRGPGNVFRVEVELPLLLQGAHR